MMNDDLLYISTKRNPFFKKCYLWSEFPPRQKQMLNSHQIKTAQLNSPSTKQQLVEQVVKTTAHPLLEIPIIVKSSHESSSLNTDNDINWADRKVALLTGINFPGVAFSTKLFLFPNRNNWTRWKLLN